LLTHSNLRRSNAQWEHFSERNENKGDVVLYRCLEPHGAQRHGYSIRSFMTRSALIYTGPELE
jgi:hypothetical protein